MLANDHIDFNFADFQLDESINSQNENDFRQRCREKIRREDTFVLLIGNDTFTKTTLVKWEVDLAIDWKVREPIVSDRDRRHPLLREIDRSRLITREALERG